MRDEDVFVDVSGPNVRRYDSAFDSRKSTLPAEAFSHFGSQFIGDVSVSNSASTGDHGPHKFNAEGILQDAHDLLLCEDPRVSAECDISGTQLNNDQNGQKKT